MATLHSTKTSLTLADVSRSLALGRCHSASLEQVSCAESALLSGLGVAHTVHASRTTSRGTNTLVLSVVLDPIKGCIAEGAIKQAVLPKRFVTEATVYKDAYQSAFPGLRLALDGKGSSLTATQQRRNCFNVLTLTQRTSS
jgi:hypothetical protein